MNRCARCRGTLYWDGEELACWDCSARVYQSPISLAQAQLELSGRRVVGYKGGPWQMTTLLERLDDEFKDDPAYLRERASIAETEWELWCASANALADAVEAVYRGQGNWHDVFVLVDGVRDATMPRDAKPNECEVPGCWHQEEAHTRWNAAAQAASGCVLCDCVVFVSIGEDVTEQFAMPSSKASRIGNQAPTSVRERPDGGSNA